jgi:ATP-dependent protease HslVU (ClpYQ) ATPase subunit
MDFRSYGIELEFADEALRLLAKRAHSEKTGARGLLSVFERVLIKFEKSLPSTEIKKLTVDRELLESPEVVLKRLLIEEGIHSFQKEFLVEHGIYLDFAEDAVERIQELAGERLKSIKQLCSDLFRDYYHGLRLMKLDHFTVPKEAVDAPDDYLNAFIKRNYGK